MPWQAFATYCAYGWVRKSDRKRRFNKIYIKVARKNAKTEYLAGIGKIGFIFDGEQDPEIYWFATKKDQAKIGWDRQKEMLKQLRKDSKLATKYCDVSTYRMYTKVGNGFVNYLGQDSDTEDGLSPYYGLCDEYHAHKTDDMMNVIESGMGTRANPMTWIITTAGFLSNGPCALFEKVCKQILDGALENDNIFPLIYDLDEGDDWEDEKNWKKANPSIEYIDTMRDFLRSAYRKAKTQGKTSEINFKTKNLNIWSTTFSTWIPADKWIEAGTDFDVSELEGKSCYGGLDLASTRDLCSLCLYFPEDKKAIWWHWVPEEEAIQRERNDGLPYRQWANDGWINLTPGNVRDDDSIINDIIKAVAPFYLESLAFDRYGANNIAPKLSDAGMEVNPFGQGFVSMSAPTKQIERLIFMNELDHGNNPVMKWQCSNVAIQQDPAENIKIAKNKSTEKVDGMVALAMAIGESMSSSQYEKVSISFI
jgi:phage terminase large subunit-like protein